MTHDSPEAILLFAAGFGTRMGALTRDRPKPLIRVGNTTLLDHALDLAQDAGIPRKVVNAHYRGGMVADHLNGSDVAVSLESPDILDTGGGLKAALPMLGPGPVFTLNTDAIWSGPNPLATLRAAWEPARMGALLLLVPLDRAIGHAGRGDFALLPDARISRGGPLVYTGAQILCPDRLSDIPEPVFSLNRLWDVMLGEGRVFGALHPGGWCDVGRPEGITLAESLLDAHG